MFVEVFHDAKANEFTFMFSVSQADEMHIADVIRQGDKIVLSLNDKFVGTEEAEFIERFAKNAQRVIAECESCLFDAAQSLDTYVDADRGKRLYYSDISDLGDDALV